MARRPIGQHTAAASARRRVTFNAYAEETKLRAARALLAARGVTISDWLTEQLESLAAEAESKGFHAEK